MSAAKTHNVGGNTYASESAPKDLRNLEKVRAIFAALSKYIHAKTIYAANNPNVVKFAETFYESYRILFEHEKELVLTIEQYQIKWNEEVVYNNNEKSASIAFLLFKDGVGEITFYSTVKPTELDQFVDLIKNEIYNPSAHLDVVSRLWQAEFKDIHYRVFDESTDGAAGEGGGAGSDSREQPLRANDHRNTENDSDGRPAQTYNPFQSLGAYLSGIVTHSCPDSSDQKKEEFLQSTLDSIFKVSAGELDSWRDEYFEVNNQDKLLWLLDVMVDFTQVHSTPAVTRDIMDIIDRVVRYIIGEAKIPSLVALLDIQKKISRSSTTFHEFQILPERIYRELTNNAFLLLLGKSTSSSREEARDALRFFLLLGKVAAPGICGLLKNSKDPLIHKEACDALISIIGDDIMPIIDDFNMESPSEARDAVYLLWNVLPGEVPPLIKEIMASPDSQVRTQALDLLMRAGTDEAAILLCRLMEDEDTGVRIKAFTTAENVAHPTVVSKLSGMCFDGDTSTRSIDELERMFRAIGTIAGEKALALLARMTRKKGWIPLGRGRNKQDKLLAITALKQIPGKKSLELLKELSHDRDSLVRTKALYALKRLGKTDDEPVLATSKEAE